MSVLRGGSYDQWKRGPAEDHPDNEEKPQFTESDVRRFVRGAYRQRDEARGQRDVLLRAAKEVARWFHQGHGDYPAANCGLCKGLLAAIKVAEGKS